MPTLRVYNTSAQGDDATSPADDPLSQLLPLLANLTELARVLIERRGVAIRLRIGPTVSAPPAAQTPTPPDTAGETPADSPAALEVEEVQILRVLLREGRLLGKVLASRLRVADNGTLRGHLSHLKGLGLIENPGRRGYALTPAGRQRLEEINTNPNSHPTEKKQ